MATVSDKIRRARPLLGTFVEIEASGASETELAAAIDAAFDAVAKVHDLMSFHQSDSDVSRINREASLRPTHVHPWTFRVLEAAVEMHRRSRGVFDIAVAPALQRLGLLPRMHDDRPIPEARHSFDAIELLPDETVRLREADICIDLGGIAKGFAVDRAIEALQHVGIPGGLVNAGGDLAAFGAGSHIINIRNPCNPSELVCAIEVSNEALASSARRVDPFQSTEILSAAVIDPMASCPSQTIDGVTVRAPSCMIADALTKVVMICGTDAGELLGHYGASALIIAGGVLQMTSDWHQAIHRAA